MRVRPILIASFYAYIHLISLEDLLFSESKWRNSGSGGREELGEVEAEEAAVGMYCMGK